MKFKLIVSTLIGCLIIGAVTKANSLKDLQGINTLTDLMKNVATLEPIKNVMSISDNEYDELRKLVLETLVKDRLVTSTDYTFEQIGLGNSHGRLFIESKEGNPLKLYVSADHIEIQYITGGESFKKAFQDYINDFGKNDQLSSFNHKHSSRIDLAYLMAVLFKDRAPLALNLDDYENLHDTNDVLSGVIKSGVNAGKEWGELRFRKKKSKRNSYPPEGMTINTFGVVQFDPSIKVGELNKPEARGSCLRKTTSCSMECVDNVDMKACLSEDAFGGRSKCTSGVIWNQNLSCNFSKQIQLNFANH